MSQAKESCLIGEAKFGSKDAMCYVFYTVALLAAIVALLPRLDGFDYFFGKYLLAEDGNIFLNQSQEMGASAIITPYAGYLHFYPRIIAGISQIFDLLYQPTVLLLGWFLAYFILVHALASVIFKIEGSLFALTVLVTLSSLQPNYGDVFFNITNSQWMLGAALCIYTMIDSNKSFQSQKTKGALLFPLALTGPFSIILTPALILKIFLKKNWSEQKYTYIYVFLGASIQLAVLLLSGRATSGVLCKDPWEWVVAFLKICSFGANSVCAFFTALVIWILIVSLFFAKPYRDKTFELDFETPGLMLFVAFLFICAGLFSHKHDPGAIVALGGGNRYSWIPYVLVLASVFMLSNGRKVIGVLIALLFAFICFTNFHRVSSPSLQYESFVKYSKMEQVFIPIHPQWPEYPGWHIIGLSTATSLPLFRANVEMTPEAIDSKGLIINFANGYLDIESTDNDPFLVFKDILLCPIGSHAVLNFYLTREKEGWMQLYWSADRNFNETASLRRWYPSGKVKAQFAFPVSPGGLNFRFDPLENDGSASIEKIELVCF